MPYRLYTTYYREWHHRRRAEMNACLLLNRQIFDEVTVLSENCPRLLNFEARWFDCSHRQRYDDVLALAADASPEDIAVIANTDIAFTDPSAERSATDASRAELDKINEHLQPNEAYALSRWDVTPQGPRLFDKAWSQDAWIFRGPPKPSIQAAFHFGVPGVDNRFAHELDAAGYTVLNPARSIFSYHLHQSAYRTSNISQNRVPLPYLWIHPHRLGEKPRYKRPNRASKRPSTYQPCE